MATECRPGKRGMPGARRERQERTTMEQFGYGGPGYRAHDDFGAANEPTWGSTQVRDAVEVQVDRARMAIARGDQALRDGVRTRPFLAVGLALAVGYLISRGVARA